MRKAIAGIQITLIQRIQNDSSPRNGATFSTNAVLGMSPVAGVYVDADLEHPGRIAKVVLGKAGEIKAYLEPRRVQFIDSVTAKLLECGWTQTDEVYTL